RPCPTWTRTADDPDAVLVHVGQGREVLLPLHAVPERLVAVLLVVGDVEGLAVARAAAVVDAEDRVAVIHQVLDEGAVSLARLAARPAVDPDERGDLALRRRLAGFEEDGRDGGAVEGFEANDLGVDEVSGVDVLREGVGETAGLRLPDRPHVEVARGTVAVDVEGEAAL